MIDLLFPRIEIESPSEVWLRAYFRAVRPANLKLAGLYIFAFCAITAVIPLLACGDSLLTFFFLIPAAVIVLFDILLVLKSWYYLSALLLLSTLLNFLLVCGVCILFNERNNWLMGIGIYYLLISAMFVWTGICYRKTYRNLEFISLRRGAEAEGIAKNGSRTAGTPFGGGLLGGAAVVFIARMITGIFSHEVLAAACIYLGGYWLNPLIAERIIFVRHFTLMKKFMSES